MSAVEIEHFHFQYESSDTRFRIDDLSLSVPEGAFCVLLGPSGCGKSTILNAVAGLLKPGRGTSIRVGGKVLFDAARRVNVAPDKREVGMVFQSYALWPHMSASDNVGYPLKRRGLRAHALRRRVGELLDLVRCGELADRYPSELSGGQQQRISLARALAAEPQLLLLDEPLSNLDAELRRDLRSELSLLHRRLGFTALYVTHDHVEALGLGSMVVVMRSGSIEQAGDPQTVFDQPQSAYTARFFGANTWGADVVGGTARTPLGAVPVPSGIEPTAIVAAYPDRVALEPADDGPLTVEDARFVGQRREFLVIDEADVRMHVHAAPLRPALRVGERVWPQVADRDVHVFPWTEDATQSGSPTNNGHQPRDADEGAPAARHEPTAQPL